jgi:serine/threonine protein kinase
MNQKEFEQRYRIEKNIGSGGFSEVYQAKERKTGRYVAIKKSQVKDEWKGFELMREYELANRLPHHDNIARYNACYRYDTGMGGIFDFAVLNFYEYGNLEQFLKRNILREEQTEQMVRGILEGLVFLHKRDIIHRDFKAQNILIDREHGVWVPKITDFGLSRAFLTEDSVHNSAIAMSYAYAAPEQLRGEKISKKVDIWAMGVLIYRIVAGELPFQVEAATDNRSTANAELTRQILSGKLPDKLNTLPQPYRSMIRRCLVHDTQLRLGDGEKLLSMLDGIRGSSNSDSAPKPVAEKDDKTIKIKEPNVEDATEVIQANEPTIRLEPENDKNGSNTDLGKTDPIDRSIISANMRAFRRAQKQDSAYLQILTKLGLYLGNKPAQRTLWYWTYIPIGIFVTSWLAFFVNGGLENKQPAAIEEAPVKSTVISAASNLKPDTVVASMIAPVSAVSAQSMDISLEKERLKLEKDRLKLEQERFKLEKERKEMASKRLVEERRQQEPKKQESSGVTGGILPAIITPAAAPIPGVPDSVLRKR